VPSPVDLPRSVLCSLYIPVGSGLAEFKQVAGMAEVL